MTFFTVFDTVKLLSGLSSPKDTMLVLVLEAPCQFCTWVREPPAWPQPND
uniref:Uncharacterized protein n=1 Tax=Octopus bimaculoides TaxID=37653 RepID=A0A0L8H1A8_OCTBM